MRIFNHFPKKSTCPICGTSEDSPCVLIPLYGSHIVPNTPAQPCHLDCVISRLQYNPYERAFIPVSPKPEESK